MVGQVEQGHAVACRPGPWRSSSSSCPGRTGRGRTPPAGRPRRRCATPGVRRPRPFPSPGDSIRRSVGAAAYRAGERGGGPCRDDGAAPATTSSRTTTHDHDGRRSRTTHADAAAARRPAPELPTAGPGERVWVLAVPFRAPAPGAVWHAGLQAHVWVGAELPPELAPYDPPPYTLRAVPRGRAEREAAAAADGPADDAARPAVGRRRRRRRPRRRGRPGLPARRRPRRRQDRHRDPGGQADRRAARRCARSWWSPTGPPPSRSRTGRGRSPASATAGCAGA